MIEFFLESAGERQYELETRIEQLNQELEYYRSISKEALLTEWKELETAQLKFKAEVANFNLSKNSEYAKKVTETRKNFETLLDGQKAISANKAK
jgi:hypothetical protein